MDDLLILRTEYWNSRLKKCIADGGFTQVSLADAINNKYGTKYGQKDVSRWTNTGTKNKNGEVGFPKYETMIRIADFFGVDVGYLLGETDDDSFLLEKACSYMGLNSAAIKAIREFTHHDAETTNYMRLDMSETLNKFFAADEFPNFFHRLFDLYLISISLNRSEERVFESQDSAIDYIRNLEYEGKIARYELNESLVFLINEIYPNPKPTKLTFL